MPAPRKSAFAEESAEVEVLFANMAKLQSITKKIQGTLNRLDTSGKTVADSVGPIYGNTQRLQVTNSNIDRVIDAIDRIRAPLDQTNREESVIRAGPRKVPLPDYLASLDRMTVALRDLKRSNLRSNQRAVTDLSGLLKMGTRSVEEVMREILREGAGRTVDALEYVVKKKPFPRIDESNISTLRLINSHLSVSHAQIDDVRESPALKAYAEIRGEYLSTSLRNLAAASVSTARKITADAIYKRGTNGIGVYAEGMEGLFLAEYENICPIFAREEWGAVYTATCQPALLEFTKTLRELNGHIQRNLMTDCFLGYEIIDIVTNLSIRLENQTGSLKRPIYDSLKPIRETSKASLPKLLEDTRTKIQSLVALPIDGAAIPVTTETMTRLQTMTAYLAPVGSLLTSLGDGNWTSSSSTNNSSTSLPSLKSFDVAPDSTQLFTHYCTDTLDTLLSNLESRSRVLLKGKSLQGVFLANNLAIIDRMIRASDLSPLLQPYAPKLDSARKKAVALYLEAWREPSSYLLDVQYTNRTGGGGRPHSNSTASSSLDSAAIVKGLSSKEKDAVKEKFKLFNASFEELVARHKGLAMEKEVKTLLGREVQTLIEPLYGRFWDRYREVDKGKGKYVRWDRAGLGGVLGGLG